MLHFIINPDYTLLTIDNGCVNRISESVLRTLIADDIQNVGNVGVKNDKLIGLFYPLSCLRSSKHRVLFSLVRGGEQGYMVCDSSGLGVQWVNLPYLLTNVDAFCNVSEELTLQHHKVITLSGYVLPDFNSFQSGRFRKLAELSPRFKLETSDDNLYETVAAGAATATHLNMNSYVNNLIGNWRN